MGLFDRFLKKNKNEELVNISDEQTLVSDSDVKSPNMEEQIPSFEDGQIVELSEGILDATSPVFMAQFKHNLEILIKKAKEEKNVSKFMIIREDAFLPKDNVWSVNSKNFELEKNVTGLSNCLRKYCALEKNDLIPKVNGVKIPIPLDKYEAALNEFPPDFANILVPVRFRSTKHFTINEPLELTGSYNNVDYDRDFVVIDSMDNFLSSGYGYSVDYRDAYLDVTHEPLKISNEAIYLIEESRYNEIIKDPEKALELKDKNVRLYRGDRILAINAVLASKGVLPAKVGMGFENYDEELNTILEDSMKKLASDNNLIYRLGHAGDLVTKQGHFSNYYDDMNKDYEQSYENLVSFLQEKFPKYKNVINANSIIRGQNLDSMIEDIGADNIVSVINEYNEKQKIELKERNEKYLEDRKKVTPEVSQIFKTTLAMISYYYTNDYPTVEYNKDLEDNICKFFHSDTVTEQLKASQAITKLLNQKEMNLEENLEVEEITVENSITEEEFENEGPKLL